MAHSTGNRLPRVKADASRDAKHILARAATPPSRPVRWIRASRTHAAVTWDSR